MANNRGWDESNSPQWRYFLSRESEQKHHRKVFRGGMSAIEEAENLFRPAATEEGEVKRNRPGKKVRQQQHQKLTKKGKKIVYSASPGRTPSSPRKK